MVKKVPEGMRNVIPSLNIEGAAKAIDLYKKAFNAEEMYRMETPNGKIMHACLRIGDSQLFLADYMPEMGCGAPSSSSFYMYFEDVDSVFNQAKQSGLSEMFAPQDMFWGDRTGTVKDPFGNTWTIASHIRDMSPEEMEKGRQEFMSKMGKAA